MVSSGSISMWGLHFRASEVKVMGCEGIHRDSGMVCAPVKKRWAGEDERSQAFQRNTPNVLEGTCTARLTRESEGVRWSVEENGS